VLIQSTADDLRRGYVSADGSRGGFHRFGCLICGVDLRRCGRRTRVKSGHKLDPTAAATSNSVPQCTVAAPTCVHRPRVPRGARSGQRQRGRRLLKTGPAGDHPAATVDVGSPTQPSRKQNGPSHHHHHHHRHGTVGRPESELVSLSHYYRRHQHRARDHSRAMRQVAEWIENSGTADAAADDTAVVRHHHHHTRRHIHEHHHHHYHYHYSVSGLV